MSADFTLGPGASDAVRDFVSAFEAYGIKSPKGSALRKKGFSQADGNGTGMISLAEMGGFIKASLEAAFDDNDKSLDLFKTFRPCYRHAFNNAKMIRSGTGEVLAGATTATADDYVSFPEFRVFTVYLCIYAAMFDVFINVDGGGAGRDENDDARISLEEFLSAYSVATEGRAFRALKGIDSDETAEELFREIDTNDGGFILFSEWSKFLKKVEIVSKTHIGTLLSGKLKPMKLSSGRRSSSSSRPKSSKPRSKDAPRNIKTPKSGNGRRSINKGASVTTPLKVSGAYQPAKALSEDAKNFINTFRPLAEKQKASLTLRKQSFRSCDVNGSGQCSLAEIDAWILLVLKKDHGNDEGLKLFKLFRPCIIVAYNGAKGVKKEGSGVDDDYINYVEFRILNAYLCIYAGMFDSFSRIDGGSAGVSADDDRRITKDEWMAGYHKFGDTGFAGLKHVKDTRGANSAFDNMDNDGGGVVRFVEFCDFLERSEHLMQTALGKLLGMQGDVTVRDRGPKPNTGG